MDSGFSHRRRASRGRQAPSTLFSRAFIPPCILGLVALRGKPQGLRLSDQSLGNPSRNPRRTLIWDSANPMPISATCG